MADYHWPNGKRIAVAVTVMLETWSEGKAPPYSVQASPLKAGLTDNAGIAWGSYGGKVGVYRLIGLLKRHAIKGTFCVNGRCAEIFPEAVAQIVKSGHDVAGHGYLQDEVMAAMDPKTEARTIARCAGLLQEVCGMRPEGWISPSLAFSAHTRDLLAAAGFAWHGDARDSDLPRVVKTGNGPIVHIPGSDFTDNRVLRSSSLDLFDVHRATFDYLYRAENGSYLALSMHCHFGGRPMIAAVFERIFTYMRGHPDVWFASHAEIARWVMDHGLEADPRRLLGD